MVSRSKGRGNLQAPDRRGRQTDEADRVIHLSAEVGHHLSNANPVVEFGWGTVAEGVGEVSLRVACPLNALFSWATRQQLGSNSSFVVDRSVNDVKVAEVSFQVTVGREDAFDVDLALDDISACIVKTLEDIANELRQIAVSGCVASSGMRKLILIFWIVDILRNRPKSIVVGETAQVWAEGVGDVVYLFACQLRIFGLLVVTGGSMLRSRASSALTKRFIRDWRPSMSSSSASPIETCFSTRGLSSSSSSSSESSL
jgi:hypothetical protein